ncbi:hypothetical protein GCM10010172_85730 [Paractinoplanes ferrugineus]|uniref:SPW repeat-containing integral membrane domain-containing protein n=1 Tax=Paractinoplanes ferrugineus TaxID=113564 RepID=A0A919JCC4_9ACTN|nr:SPW repeat protein [Actinoplanes ferrugineus]GIE16719.1 hypothetical protein Afe05nite_85590 [Actinoplanes ferrugineus]
MPASKEGSPATGSRPAAAPLSRRLTTDLAYTPSAFVTLAGLWLVLSPPAVADRATYAWWSDVACGSAIAVLGAIRVVRPRGTGVLGAITAVLGGWLIAAPFVLGFAEVPSATWNHIVVGAVVVVIAGVSVFTGDGQAGP